MRLILSLGVVSLALAGCVAPVTTAPPPAVVNPPPIAPPTSSIDSSTRAVARDVVNREMAKRLPGANVAPYTDCVLQNASPAELAAISGAADAGATVAGIVARPATSQCIAGAAAAAKRVA